MSRKPPKPTRTGTMLLSGIFLFLSIALFQLLWMWKVIDLTMSSVSPIHFDDPLQWNNPTATVQKVSSSSSSSSLPIIKQHQGGLIVFLHIPKTGGSTIRDTLQNISTIRYHFVSGAKTFHVAHQDVLQYLSTKKRQSRKTFVLEIHGRDSPHLLSLVETFHQYRQAAQERNLPCFFFTLLREPLQLAISYFNFFHVQRGPNPYFRQVLPTETNLLQWSLYNPQCQFLARGEFSLRQKIKQQPTMDECQQVEEALLQTMDWVGTTENLSTETLPLLRTILNDTTLAFHTSRVTRKARNESISFDQLSSNAIQVLMNMSTMDTTLYERMRIQYSFSMWNNIAHPIW